MKHNFRVYVNRATQRLMKERRRRRANNLSAVQRHEAAKRSAEKASTVQRVCERYWDLAENYVEELVRLGMKEPAARRRLQRLSGYGFRRKPNAYNAFIHIKSLEINPDLPEGDKHRLADLQQLAQSMDWATFSRDRRNREEIESMKAAVLQYRQTKVKGVRSQRKAQAKDVSLTLSRIDSELSELAARSDVSNLRVTVRQKPSQTVFPNACGDPVMKQFVQVCLGLTWDDFVKQLEAYSVSGLVGVVSNENKRKVMHKKSIRNMIRSSLHEATGISDVEMSWKNYDRDIVSELGVELVGWPVRPIGPIDNLNCTTLNDIVNGLTNGSIYWTTSGKEAHANGDEGPSKPRKLRSDKGKKRGPYAKRAAAQTEMSMDEERDEEMNGESDT
ncbi:hypothetical protein DFH11DRAFT_1726643 [Phellopilus nigrolimitatus]|nr:hypothetical protein DFH11DRAFT_1726643 [Phellopilus nigrolimitatus]